MTKYLSLLLAVYLPMVSCGQTKINNENGFIIDPSIKIEVEKHVETSKEFNALSDKILVYNNSVIIQAYENDKLIFDSKGKPTKQVFKSFYLWRGDTLKIDGAFGLFTGIGFAIDIQKGKATLYHLLSSDETPAYAYIEKGSLISRLEVPCTETKIVLSEMPNSSKKQVIYGYVEFKSGDYYASGGSVDGKEELPRKKLRDNMKIYFKCGKLDL